MINSKSGLHVNYKIIAHVLCLMYAQRWFYAGLLGNDFNPKWVWPKQEDLPALGNMHRTVNPTLRVCLLLPVIFTNKFELSLFSKIQTSLILCDPDQIITKDE